jgi:hypothetical protein
MSGKKTKTQKIEKNVDPEAVSDAIDIEIISTKIFRGGPAASTLSSLIVYREDLKLPAEPIDYAALVITSIEAQEDGSVVVHPLALAATSMDHVSQFSGIREWVHL